MKKIFYVVIAFFSFNFTFADALKNLETQQVNLLKSYEQTLSEIAKERAILNEKIIVAENETKALEAELKAVREATVDYDLALKNLTYKTSQYDLLRRKVIDLAESLNTKKILPARDFEGLYLQLNSLLKEADTEIFSAKILNNAILGMSGADFLNSLESKKRFNVKFDTSLGKLSLVKTRAFMQKVEAGGLWIYPILMFGIIAFLVSVFKLITSFSIKKIKPQCLEKINLLLEKGDVKGAMNIAKLAPKPHFLMLKKFLENYGISKVLIEEISYEQMLIWGEKLFSGLGLISITAAISPLLGLLGTVTGIIKTFGDLSIYGAGNPQLMSEGISEALITTEFGLIVAIPAFIMHAILSRRAKSILSDMEKVASEYISKNCK